ncbi:hypothetical protein ACXU4B_11405 [Dyella soli]|uniref:Uncharacterized protein n=1 Tax=Dyella soli TaxID=522319 RepID=A0A4R0YN42_9GAMM|nr:hypothetical protein [Dyella soli]TCI07229.1 hypothetical protein EZM97_32025 [Dyella soli]
MKRTITLLLPWLLALVVGAAAVMLRHGLVESTDVARVCEASPLFACKVRHLAVMGFITGNVFGWQIGVFGWVAIIATLLVLWRIRLATAWLATAAGLFAVVLYCFVPGALALLIGSLRMVRVQAAGTSPVDHHGGAQREIHAQP